MQHDKEKYLYDVKEACEYILRNSKNKKYFDFHNDELLSVAVERKFEVIGEALNNALKYYPELENQISHIRRIISFRHKISHGYYIIEDNFYGTQLKFTSQYCIMKF
jgi:uncharacterized protein with HEPN domain